MDEISNKKTPRDILRVIFRRKRLFLLGASLFAIAAMLGAHHVPVKYTGTTMFERRTDVAAGRTLERDSESFETIKLTLRHELAGRNAVERVAEELGLTRGLPHDTDGNLTYAGEMAKQDIVRMLMNGIKVKWEVRSRNVDLLSVSATHRDQKLARKIPDLLVANYINRVYEGIKRRLTASQEFLLKQVNECKSRLMELTNKKVDFETRHAGMMPESPGTLQERIQQVSADIEALRRQQNTARQVLAQLQVLRQATTSPSSQPAQVVKGPNPELKRLKDELKEFENQLDAALTLSHMTEKHPTVKTLRSKIARLEKRIKETPAEAVLHTVYGSGDIVALRAQMIKAKSELDISTEELKRLRSRLAAYEALMANFAPIRQEYEQIIAKVQKQETELERWQSRLTEVQMALEAEAAKRRTHLNAVQVAQEQIRPSFPSLWVVLALAILGGLAFGGGLVFLSNVMDRSITTTEDAIEYFGVPVHGVTSEIIPRHQRAVNCMRRWIMRPIVMVIVLVGLLVSGLSVTLWLRSPQQYKEWKASPIGFVYRNLTNLNGSIPKSP